LDLPSGIHDAHKCDAIVTLGRYRIVCAELSGSTWHLPATPTEVRDVCGAGDTVFAALSVEIVTGKSLRDA
jgi:bifunctional ADP-heptose synthase (sugar kinase/adenylyltransferase)